MSLAHRVIIAALALAIATALTSCSPGELTEIVVVVDSELAVPGALDEVTILAEGPSGIPKPARALLSGSGAATLPVTLGVRPSATGNPSVIIRAEGRLLGARRVSAEVRTNFIEGRRLVLRIVLLSACVGVECASGFTCAPTGECVDAAVDPGTLPLFTGTLPLGDLGASDADTTDAGMTDAASSELGVDSGPVDAGVGIVGADACGDPATPVLARTTRGLRVDTNTATGPSLRLGCNGSIAGGQDRFYAIDVAAGELWHLDLASDPAFPGETDRNPILYVVAGLPAPATGCVDTLPMCATVYSDVCRGRSDEHLTFVAPAAGRYYIGVDDAVAGGGHYVLDAYRPLCGDGRVEPGESCDNPSRDVCSALCQALVGVTALGAFPAEVEFNHSAVEANLVSFVGTSSVEITGQVGGPECYPDYFQVPLRISDGGLAVDVLTPGGLPCSDPTTVRFLLSVIDPSGAGLGSTADAAGCPRILLMGTTEGTYTVKLEALDPAAATAASYRLRVQRLNPP